MRGGGSGAAWNDGIPLVGRLSRSLNRKDMKSMKDMKGSEGIEASVHRT